MFNKDSKTIKDIKKKIQELENDISLIHELLQPSEEELPSVDQNNDDYYTGTTTEIPADIYDKIVKYCENKNYIFMGVA
jgi:uncharacterized protein YaaN involved in tellurite resistance